MTPQAPRIASGTVHMLVRTPAAVAAEIRQALSEQTIIPAHLFYEGRGGAANWTEVAAGSTYASAGDSAALFRERGEAIGEAVAGAAGDRSIRMVSLGPGSGWKDELLIRAIVGRVPEPLAYYALDTSPMLAVQAMTRILAAEGLAAVEATAMAARFDDLPSLRRFYEAPGAVNLFMLLGNTLGNVVDEVRLLGSLGSGGMNEGDLLLLEVTLQTPGADEIAGLGDLPTIRRFNFAPLAEIGVGFEPERLTYRVAAGKGAIPGTLTVVASYRGFAVDGRWIESADLAYVHRYQAAAVYEALDRAGFAPCLGAAWLGPRRRSMLVLARRGPQQVAPSAGLG